MRNNCMNLDRHLLKMQTKRPSFRIDWNGVLKAPAVFGTNNLPVQTIASI
jgi:hypothetical protein